MNVFENIPDVESSFDIKRMQVLDLIRLVDKECVKFVIAESHTKIVQVRIENYNNYKLLFFYINMNSCVVQECRIIRRLNANNKKYECAVQCKTFDRVMKYLRSYLAPT